MDDFSYESESVDSDLDLQFFAPGFANGTDMDILQSLIKVDQQSLRLPHIEELLSSTPNITAKVQKALEASPTTEPDENVKEELTSLVGKVGKSSVFAEQRLSPSTKSSLPGVKSKSTLSFGSKSVLVKNEPKNDVSSESPVIKTKPKRSSVKQPLPVAVVHLQGLPKPPPPQPKTASESVIPQPSTSKKEPSLLFTLEPSVLPGVENNPVVDLQKQELQQKQKQQLQKQKQLQKQALQQQQEALQKQQALQALQKQQQEALQKQKQQEALQKQQALQALQKQQQEALQKQKQQEALQQQGTLQKQPQPQDQPFLQFNVLSTKNPPSVNPSNVFVPQNLNVPRNQDIVFSFPPKSTQPPFPNPTAKQFSSSPFPTFDVQQKSPPVITPSSPKRTEKQKSPPPVIPQPTAKQFSSSPFPTFDVQQKSPPVITPSSPKLTGKQKSPPPTVQQLSPSSSPDTTPPPSPKDVKKQNIPSVVGTKSFKRLKKSPFANVTCDMDETGPEQKFDRFDLTQITDVIERKKQYFKHVANLENIGFNDTSGIFEAPFCKGALRIMTYNVHGFKDYLKTPGTNTLEYSLKLISDVVRLIEITNPDVILFQEFPVNERSKEFLAFANTNFINSNYEIQTRLAPKSIPNRMVYKKSLKVIEVQQVVHYATPSRYLDILKLNVNGNDFIIINTHFLPLYGSETSRVKWRDHSKKIVDLLITNNYFNGFFIIGGDFNAEYTRNPQNNSWNLWKYIASQPKITEVNKYLSGFNIVVPKYTHWYGKRVDQFLIGTEIENSILGEYIYYTNISDHLPVMVDLHLADSGNKIKETIAEMLTKAKEYDTLFVNSDKFESCKYFDYQYQQKNSSNWTKVMHSRSSWTKAYVNSMIVRDTKNDVDILNSTILPAPVCFGSLRIMTYNVQKLKKYYTVNEFGVAKEYGVTPFASVDEFGVRLRELDFIISKINPDVILFQQFPIYLGYPKNDTENKYLARFKQTELFANYHMQQYETEEDNIPLRIFLKKQTVGRYVFITKKAVIQSSSPTSNPHFVTGVYISWNDQVLFIANTQLSSKNDFQRKGEINQLLEMFQNKFTNDNFSGYFVLGGDFNAEIFDESLSVLKKNGDMVDLWEQLKKTYPELEAPEYTNWNWTNVDRIFFGNTLIDNSKILDGFVYYTPFSDHLPVFCDIYLYKKDKKFVRLMKSSLMI